MRNEKGVVIGTGESSPIMVTDDHKSYTSPPENNDSTFPVSCNSMSDIQHPAIMYYPPSIDFPILDSINPCRGSGWGGHKVTIMGFGFHGYLIPMFNRQEAIVTGWSSTTIHCILPPAVESAGPVIVSFKHQTLNTTHPLFYYTEQENKSILDLAIKITGNHNTSPSSTVEMNVIQLLSQQVYTFNTTTEGGQTLLHLASYFNYTQLMRFLIAKDVSLVYKQDHNGLSALHFGCLAKSSEAICILLKWGASIALPSVIGTPMDIVSNLLSRDITIDKTESDWIPNLFSKLVLNR